MRLARLQSGNLGDCKNIGKGVSEPRLDFGPGYRIYFAQIGTTLVVLLGAGEKSTQERDIARAQELWEEHKDAIERYQRGLQE